MRHARVLLAMLCCGCALACASCGPHMDNQPSIRPWEREMPQIPAGTVPTAGTMSANTALIARTATNPVPATPQAVSDGRIFYGYYCLMCHGKNGKGNGPVGESYMPKPADLTSARIAAMSDGQLYRAMLTGVGHSPVMESTVPLDQRWPIVLYMRRLARR